MLLRVAHFFPPSAQTACIHFSQFISFALNHDVFFSRKIVDHFLASAIFTQANAIKMCENHFAVVTNTKYFGWQPRCVRLCSLFNFSSFFLNCISQRKALANIFCATIKWWLLSLSPFLGKCALAVLRIYQSRLFWHLHSINAFMTPHGHAFNSAKKTTNFHWISSVVNTICCWLIQCR